MTWQLIQNQWIIEEERAETEMRIGETHQIDMSPEFTVTCVTIVTL
jgi:hypothetical protein